MRSALIALSGAVVLVCASGCGGDSSPISGTTKSAGSPAQPDPAAEAARAKARAEADAARDAERLARLWNYYEQPVGKGLQLSASLFSTNGVDADGLGARSVRLVFREHPEWGKASYLVLETGDFQCYAGCRVAVTIDDNAPVRMAAKRPKTDEAIAMFINDAPALWRLIRDAKRLSVEFPVKAGGTRSASFEVSGLDRSKMPGWDKSGSTKTRGASG
jgi:hypothetical protein